MTLGGKSMTNNMKIPKIPIHLEKERYIVFDLNALCALEDKFGDFSKAMDNFKSGKVKAVRTFLWAGLVHEDPTLTEEQVGASITMLNIEEISLALVEAISASFPQVKNVNTSLTLEEIVKNAGGTGTGSTI